MRLPFNINSMNTIQSKGKGGEPLLDSQRCLNLSRLMKWLPFYNISLPSVMATKTERRRRIIQKMRRLGYPKGSFSPLTIEYHACKSNILLSMLQTYVFFDLLFYGLVDAFYTRLGPLRVDFPSFSWSTLLLQLFIWLICIVSPNTPLDRLLSSFLGSLPSGLISLAQMDA